MENTIKTFIRKSVDINMTIMGIFNDKLGLPNGALESLHRMEEHSCSESRLIKKPPTPGIAADRQVVGAHTDFGSLVRANIV